MVAWDISWGVTHSDLRPAISALSGGWEWSTAFGFLHLGEADALALGGSLAVRARQDHALHGSRHGAADQTVEPAPQGYVGDVPRQSTMVFLERLLRHLPGFAKIAIP
jgi:hypothetical protein